MLFWEPNNFFFTLFLLNSVLLCFPISALSCQRSNGSESNNVLLRLPFHLPASKTSLWSQRTLLEMELHRLCACTVCLSAFDSKSHNWLISPYSQTAFCAVLHVLFRLYQPKKRNEMISHLTHPFQTWISCLHVFRYVNITNIIYYDLLL